MECKIDLNEARLKQRFGPQAVNDVQKKLDIQVMKDCAPYVPRVSGDLEDSVITGTTVGSGVLKWQMIYAAYQYYSGPNKSTNKHPLATMRWFEAAKAVRKAAWERVAKRAGW